ncbi:DUF4064 domain-containing protein [Methanococcoides orientis]|uniref:DUF4064 domain-containing protein n=1 Tax=Methanococcoides orientis TaxID=2822137 RepID=UPI001E4514A8|nr:DUF4064 domain-containing protein [Methanococcoides orientis]UGV41329.1 DUF4064 domain-containing protein [Methanococcoides orientis]
MSKETAIILGASGGIFGVGASAITFLVAAYNFGFGSRIIDYAPSQVFGIANFIVLGLGLIALALSMIGIAGSVVARTDKKKGAKLMLASGIFGFFLLFALWIMPGILLTAGGIIAMRTDEGTM